MSQFLSHKYLKYRDALRGVPIDVDRLCNQCDYNLRGLRIGGRCPECGSAIQLENPMQDALADAPVRIIRGLRNGFWLLAPAIVLFAGVPVVALFGTPGSGGYSVIFMLIAWLLWSGGVWLLTNPIETDRGRRYGFSRQSSLRIVTRWLNLCWLGVAIASVLLAFAAPAVGGGVNLLLGAAISLLGLAGLAGVVVLTILLSKLADWCYDETASKMLTWAMWTLPISTLMLASPLVAAPLGLLICGGSLLWLSGLISLAASIIILSRSVNWSLRHAIERAERDRALAERSATP